MGPLATRHGGHLWEIHIVWYMKWLCNKLIGWMFIVASWSLVLVCEIRCLCHCRLNDSVSSHCTFGVCYCFTSCTLPMCNFMSTFTANQAFVLNNALIVTSYWWPSGVFCPVIAQCLCRTILDSLITIALPGAKSNSFSRIYMKSAILFHDGLLSTVSVSNCMIFIFPFLHHHMEQKSPWLTCQVDFYCKLYYFRITILVRLSNWTFHWLR